MSEEPTKDRVERLAQRVHSGLKYADKGSFAALDEIATIAIGLSTALATAKGERDAAVAEGEANLAAMTEALRVANENTMRVVAMDDALREAVGRVVGEMRRRGPRGGFHYGQVVDTFGARLLKALES